MKYFIPFITLSISFLFLSCAPVTKEDYLSEFSEFMSQVDDEKKKNNDADWKEYDKKFEYYNSELYEKFKNELDLMDEVKVNTYRVRYNVKRHKTNFFENLLNNKNIKQMKRDIMQYVDEELEGDLEVLLDNMDDLSDDLKESLKEIVEEIKIEIEENE